MNEVEQNRCWPCYWLVSLYCVLWFNADNFICGVVCEYTVCIFSHQTTRSFLFNLILVVMELTKLISLYLFYVFGIQIWQSSNEYVLQACCVEYIILESDNLSSLFPNAHLSLGGLQLNSHHLFALMTTLAVLPTVWLRDMSILSYISGTWYNILHLSFSFKSAQHLIMMLFVFPSCFLQWNAIVYDICPVYFLFIFILIYSSCK